MPCNVAKYHYECTEVSYGGQEDLREPVADQDPLAVQPLDDGGGVVVIVQVSELEHTIHILYIYVCVCAMQPIYTYVCHMYK